VLQAVTRCIAHTNPGTRFTDLFPELEQVLSDVDPGRETTEQRQSPDIHRSAR